MSKREFTLLAHVLDVPGRVRSNFKKFMVSEKLDGMRCLWDGGITRGMGVPFLPKGEKATGLWSRYAKVIHAPSSYLDKLPPVPLDGELWMGRHMFQETMAIVKRKVPIEYLWRHIDFMCFDIPSLSRVWDMGEIDNANCHLEITNDLNIWMNRRAYLCNVEWENVHTFDEVYPRLQELANKYEGFKAHEQVVHSGQFSDLEEQLDRVVANKGEGLMLRSDLSAWLPERSWDLLKLKPALDSEAEVVGYTWGRETDKGSKLLGLMGAMTLKWNGQIFDLSGFTDEERTMTSNVGDAAAFAFGRAHQGEIVSEGFWNKRFPRGSKVTFTYRELTNAGIPKEARFLRKHIV